MKDKEKAEEIAKLHEKTYSVYHKCCDIYDESSFEECYDSALQMAEWKDKQFQEEKKQLIEKACNYLYNNIDKDLIIYHDNTWLKLDKFVKQFKKVLEE